MPDSSQTEGKGVHNYGKTSSKGQEARLEINNMGGGGVEVDVDGYLTGFEEY